MKKREFLAGLFLAMAVMLKITPIILMLFLIIDRRWKLLFASFFFLFILTLTTVVFINPEYSKYFFEIVLPNLAMNSKAEYYNQALSGFLLREIPNSFLLTHFKTGLNLFLFVSSIFVIWKHSNKNMDTKLLSISVLMTLGLIINSFSWQHHFVWLLIPLLITFVVIKNNHLSIKCYIFLAISFFLVAINIKDPSVVSTIFQSHVLYGSLLLYILDIYLLISLRKRKVIRQVL